MEKTCIPVNLNKCPIAEAVVEIRFKSEMPDEAVFGMIYSEVSEFFKPPKKLPVLQLPEAIRNSDPNLRYQSYYSLQSIASPNMQLSIGPRSIVFASIKKYVGWNNFSDFIKMILKRLENKKVVSVIERIGVRYINFFNTDVLEKIDANLHIGQFDLRKEPTTLRTEVRKDDFINIINIANQTSLKINGQQSLGSLIDLDFVKNFNKWKDWDCSSCFAYISTGHTLEKESFFNLLTEQFLETLEPQY